MKVGLRHHKGWPMLCLMADNWAFAFGPPWAFRADGRDLAVELLPRLIFTRNVIS